MNFSFVLPSRGDELWVKKFLNSLERTTRYKDKIEVLFAIDEGKTEIIEAVAEEKYSFSIKFFERPKTKDFTNDYYNWLADRSCGDNIWAFNDDAWMRTKHWDKKILKHIENSRWSIYMVDVFDSARLKYRNTFPCFPLVSRRAFCLLGFLLFPPIKMYPADQWTNAVYHDARRIIRINDVMIEHEHISENDSSKKEMLEIFKSEIGNIQMADTTESTNILLRACSTDFIRRKSKLTRIIEVLKEA